MKRFSATPRTRRYQLGFLLMAVLLGSCASPRNLEFKPPIVLPVLPARLQAPAHFEPIGMARPIDNRTDKEFCCGADLAEAGSMIVPIPYKISTSDAPVWIGNGLALGLENAGYEVVPVKDAKSANTNYVIGIELTEVGIHQGFPVGTYVVGATVELSRRGAQLLRRDYQASYTPKPIGGAPKDTRYAAANDLNVALEDLIQKVVPDLAAEIVRPSNETQRLTKTDSNATRH